MTFQEDKVSDFLQIFEESKEKIRAMSGCFHLELQQDIHHTNILMTKSHWESENALNAYRDSELFRLTWAKTKALFAEKPMAFSMQVVSKTTDSISISPSK